MENHFYQIPAHLRPKNEGTDHLFKKGWLEKLTRTHIAIPITMHMMIIIAFGYMAFMRLNTISLILSFSAGWLFWTFAEYAIHRFIYHIPTENKILLKIQHLGHGIHHQYPKDPTRLAMPPIPAFLMMAALFGIYWLIIGELAFAFFPGFVAGYLFYISLHYAQHVVKPPSFEPMRKLWKYHAMHHYKHPEDHAFGVSTLLWDVIFDTLPPKEKS
ncbi:MAG: sterol desaturase/sphingolipid hydroxylase (fatty acid hydroxylase superfamily) [Marinoscillum sp.]|jgi:4-hydroxysphinganine ceramide fatty acyl 2-hydroxylase